MFLFNVVQIIQDAVEDLFNKYLPMMENLARSIIRDNYLSEDAVQEALFRLSQNADKIDNINSNRSKNYVYTVTKNEAIKILEKEIIKNNNEIDIHLYIEKGLDIIEGQLDIDAFCDKYGFGLNIVEALKKLSETDRDIIIYKYGAGHSLKEIADIMDMGREAVYKRHQRTLNQLKKELEVEDEKR